MGKVHVNANGLSVVHKDSDGVATATLPDVCKTQIGNTVVPIPYSNVAYSKDLKKGSKNVKINGNSVAIQGSEFSKSTGDDAGRLGGVMSGTNKDKATWLSYSFTVEIEGKGVCRLTDKMMMNNGNTACLAGIVQEPVEGTAVEDAQQKVIKAKITELSFETAIKTAVEKNTVNAPHWKDGEKPDYEQEGYGAKKGDYGSCAKKPAVYSIAAAKTDDCYVNVTLNVSKLKNISGKATLLGNLGGLKMQKKFELTGEQEYPLKVKIENSPEGIRWYKGKIIWQLELESESETRSLNDTFAEVFFILDKPADFYSRGQDAKGVWAEVLRFLCKKAMIVNSKDDKAALDSITRYCFTKHNLKYDSAGGGGSKYGVGRYGGNFALEDYLIRKKELANCYDQAAAIQALCGAVGVKLRWIYMDPFGYLKKVQLLGWGECNNPFFLYRGYNSKKVLEGKDLNDPTQRSGFGNHAFCDAEEKVGAAKLVGKLYDACAGPHTGDSKKRYIATTIDTESILGKSFHGTIDNMYYNASWGVTGVSGKPKGDPLGLGL